MATEAILSGDGIRAPSAAAQELNFLLRERSRGRSSSMHLHRSESAPPSVEGSLAAMQEIFGTTGELNHHHLGHIHSLQHHDDDDEEEEQLLLQNDLESEVELRSHPAYLAYYHSHVNLNPRLPPPLKSWETWRLAHRLHSAARDTAPSSSAAKLRFLDDHQRSGTTSSSFFSTSASPGQRPLPTHKEDPEPLLDDDSLDQLLLHHSSSSSAVDVLGLGRPKSLVDLIQEDFPRTPSPVYNLSRSSSRAANNEATDLAAAAAAAAAVGSRSTTPNPIIAPFHEAEAATRGFGSRSTTPIPLSAGEALESSMGGVSTGSASTLAAAFTGLSMKDKDEMLGDNESHNLLVKQQQAAGGGAGGQVFSQQQQQQLPYRQSQQGMNTSLHSPPGGGAAAAAAASNVYAAAAAAAAMSYIAAGNPYYHNLHSGSVYPPPHFGYPLLPHHHPMMPGYPAPPPPLGFDAARLSGQTLHEALYLQYLRASEDARAAAALTADMRGYAAASDSIESQLLGLNSKSHFSRSVPVPSKPLPAAAPYYGSPPGLGFSVPFSNSPLPSPGLPSSPVGPSLRRDDHRNLRLPSRGASYASWPTPGGSDSGDDARGSFLLEDFKNSKSRRFELSDIVGHVVEFSADQHGSRFIQQKLETATSEEKNMVFQEVYPHAVALMTDVFGNYVIQKFFEHGTPQQRKELAQQLLTRVLTLSLQMYGCRVIQKALEVVDVEQQIQLVSELDGHVMRCVRDQNGNHVIQKCIECVPPHRIHFIVSSFYGQVVALSTHPYGCRVVQRVLEHCTDEQKQQGIMQEILRSTCSLAQDQYGNYVVQHVLEHGTQAERSEIITKLAGQIVQMSQHKFASNVIEKCLEFGGTSERQIIISEMLGSIDDKEPLQAMMKDQFANYVVQKVLEICDDQQREILLTRIKAHLHALKKYTYGKHIVARVEKLVAAGERRSAAAAAAAAAAHHPSAA